MKRDFLIVGSGLAGCLTAWELSRHEKSFLLIDHPNQTSASQVAAGIINPVTGKRFVLLDDFHQYLDTAKTFYRDLENTFRTSFLFPLPIIRIFKSEKDQILWNQVRNKPEQQGYLKQYNPAGVYKDYVRDNFGSLEFQGFYVDGKKLITHLQIHFQKHILEENFDHTDLEISSQEILWKNHSFDHVIFCEGYRAQNNPYFDWIPFKHAKGEMLIIETSTPNQPHGLLNFGKWLQPLGKNIWKVGATFQWENIDDHPSDIGKQELLQALNTFSPMNYTVKNHIAGVRPVVRDLNPLLGTHPEQTRLSMINGLGSKGYLYAPTYVPQHLDHILHHTKLPSQLSIHRFF